MNTIYVIQKQITAEDKSLKWLDSSIHYIDLESATKAFMSVIDKHKTGHFQLVKREVCDTVLKQSNNFNKAILTSEDDF